jgi:DNA-binding transcriptional ArsR family regulator
MEIRRDVFQAIADPNRRAIIHLVANQKLTLNGVADHFDISRPAISKHIKILTECGLITINQQGRERYCEARLEKLSEVATWVEEYKKFWEIKLDALESYLHQIQSKKEGNGKKGKPAKKKEKKRS